MHYVRQAFFIFIYFFLLSIFILAGGCATPDLDPPEVQEGITDPGLECLDYSKSWYIELDGFPVSFPFDATEYRDIPIKLKGSKISFIFVRSFGIDYISGAFRLHDAIVYVDGFPIVWDVDGESGIDQYYNLYESLDCSGESGCVLPVKLRGTGWSPTSRSEIAITIDMIQCLDPNQDDTI